MKIKIFSFIIIICFISVLTTYGQIKLPSASYKNMYEMLKEVPGLEVSSNGGKTGTIIIRGIGSFKNQQPPLIVLDGSIFNGNIIDINTQDVDNISVLKDAASTTVYGAQGSSGVILITTKKGTMAPAPKVSNYNKSAYSYFIEHQTKLRIIGLENQTLLEGVIQSQIDSSLIFIKKKKSISIPISSIKRVEIIPED